MTLAGLTLILVHRAVAEKLELVLILNDIHAPLLESGRAPELPVGMVSVRAGGKLRLFVDVGGFTGGVESGILLLDHDIFATMLFICKGTNIYSEDTYLSRIYLPNFGTGQPSVQ